MIPGEHGMDRILGVAPRTAAAPSIDPRFSQGPFLMHLNRGRQLLRAGRLESAREELESALRLKAHDESVLNLLGAIYFKLDQREAAMRVYRALLQLHPEADVLHANLGVLEYKEGRMDDARRRLETALLLNPANPRPRLYLGLIERREGRLETCLEHLHAAGAHELAGRIELTERGGPHEPGDDVDTGPMPAVGERETGGDPPLERFLECQEDVTSTSGEASFRINRGGGHGGSDTLSVEFMRAICVRAGSALYVDGAVRAEETTEPSFVALKGRGHVEISSPTGGVLLIQLQAGQSLCVGAERLLAFEAGIGVRSGGGGLSRMMGEILTGALLLHGEGVLALAAGRRPRIVKLHAEETLLTSPRDLLCWTHALRARPNSPGRLDDLLRAGGPEGSGAIRLEGEGTAILDLLT